MSAIEPSPGQASTDLHSASSIPIILLTGMGADERLLDAQTRAFPNLRVQPWIPPRSGETLRAYAARLAAEVDPGRPCIVGGASFGGAVALEMAPHLQALGCILIGSIRSPAGIPWNRRMLRPLSWLGPDGMACLARVALRLGGPFWSRRRARQLQKLGRPEGAFVRWAMCAVLGWRPSAESARVSVFHIHGSHDRVLPVSLGRPDVVIPGGEHALAWLSASQVNQYIAQVLAKFAS